MLEGRRRDAGRDTSRRSMQQKPKLNDIDRRYLEFFFSFSRSSARCADDRAYASVRVRFVRRERERERERESSDTRGAEWIAVPRKHVRTTQAKSEQNR